MKNPFIPIESDSEQSVGSEPSQYDVRAWVNNSKPPDKPKSVGDFPMATRKWPKRKWMDEDDDNPFTDAMQMIASTIRQGFSAPKRNLLKFNGDPLDFYEFIADFDSNVDEEYTEQTLE